MLLLLCLRKPINQSLSTSCSRSSAVPDFQKMRLISQSPNMAYSVVNAITDCRKGRLVDQSPSISCLVVRTVPRISNGQTGGPVPERLMLGGRYSPQDIKWADWSTSPRASHAWWSVQSSGYQMGRLVDQSPSISCSVVGTVPRISNGKTS